MCRCVPVDHALQVKTPSFMGLCRGWGPSASAPMSSNNNTYCFHRAGPWDELPQRRALQLGPGGGLLAAAAEVPQRG
jgi:hypothetical protein